MPKKRKPTATPKQLHSQKPKKQQKQQRSTKKTTRVSLGLPTDIPKINTKGSKIKSSKAPKVEQQTSRLTDMETGEVVQEILPTVNTDENFYSTFIIESWRRQLETYSSGEAYNMLKNWLDDMIAQNGKDNVAEMLQRGASEGHLLTWETVYKVGEAERYISAMLDYLPDQSELYKEEIQDKFEYYKTMTDYMEQEENWEEPV